jgi:hypothetical protein
MAVPLSPATKQRLQLIFRPEDHTEAETLLVEECGNNLPFLEKLNGTELERYRFAALKVSSGNLSSLYEAVQLAQEDWRDLLVAADFANDILAHKKWLA